VRDLAGWLAGWMVSWLAAPSENGIFLFFLWHRDNAKAKENGSWI
jgi:hypothetical protein